jgi:hypothetical protein
MEVEFYHSAGCPCQVRHDQSAATHIIRSVIISPSILASLRTQTMGLKILDHTGSLVTHGRERLDNGVRLHYYTAGTGPALLLQHGVSLHRNDPTETSSTGPKNKLLLA